MNIKAFYYRDGGVAKDTSNLSQVHFNVVSQMASTLHVALSFYFLGQVGKSIFHALYRRC